LNRLEYGSVRYNLGTGTGHSVLDVVRAVERVSGRRVPLRTTQRRPGDPAILVASPARIAKETGWKLRFSALDHVIETTINWRIAHPCGYGDR